MSTFVADPNLLASLTDADDAGYLKAGAFGFEKSGKTFTAILLACAVRRHFGLENPIGMWDTETGSLYVKHVVKSLTGHDLLYKKSRSYDQLMKWLDACVKAKLSAVVIDSVSHISDELRTSLLAQINEQRARKGKWQLQKLEFQDQDKVTERMKKLANFYLNAPIHIIVCGRGQNIWEWEQKEDGSGKKELIKAGTKMRASAEFGYEPSLLVEMGREEEFEKDAHRLVKTATVLGDRFGVIDGRKVVFESTPDVKKAMEAVYQAFKPHLDLLVAGSHATVDTEAQTDFALTGDDENWAAEKKQREILAEEIKGEMVRVWPGRSNDEAKQKLELIEAVFGTRSWAKVECMPSEKLRAGLAKVKEIVAALVSAQVSPAGEEVKDG